AIWCDVCCLGVCHRAVDCWLRHAVVRVSHKSVGVVVLYVERVIEARPLEIKKASGLNLLVFHHYLSSHGLLYRVRTPIHLERVRLKDRAAGTSLCLACRRARVL